MNATAIGAMAVITRRCRPHLPFRDWRPRAAIKRYDIVVITLDICPTCTRIDQSTSSNYPDRAQRLHRISMRAADFAPTQVA